MSKYFCTLLLFFYTATSGAYWQQGVNTLIRVSLDDKLHMLRGVEEMVYTNNSPDTLTFLYIHLWPNAYKNDRTQFSEQQVENGKTDFYFSPEKDKGFIDSLQFTVNGEAVDYSFYMGNIDIAKIDLPKALAPGDSIKVETPFRVKIPQLFSRLGHNGQAYFISQWFPKPAVYDRKGWHPIPYLDQGEFYSEFGHYDVSIALPKNYILMATGNCETPSEQIWMDSLSRIDLPNDTLYKNQSPVSEPEYKTVRFTENNIHDFAWFADKRWVLRKDSISGEGNIGTTKIYTAFLPGHQAEWSGANDLLKEAINSYGRAVGKYPYQTIKAVEGDMSAGGGMEYPTVTIIDKAAVRGLSLVIIHEAGHNWFYGMLGTNERLHPWMDEGMNSFYEQKTSRFLNDGKSTSKSNTQEDYSYFQQVAAHKDQAITLPSTAYTSVNYGAVVYYKSALLLEWLESYMGKAQFESGMKSYFDEWHFKHPYPEDFKGIMQAHSDKDLSWFFDNAIYSVHPIDFAIRGAKWDKDSLRVFLKNKSDVAAPVLLSFYKNDSLIGTKWKEPFIGKTTIAIKQANAVDKILIASDFADLRMSNNELVHRKLFKKGIVDIGAGFGLNRQSVRKIYVAPAFGYNHYDGIGLGLLCHNLTFPQNRFQFAMAPQVGFSSKQLNGMASFAYSWYTKSIFQEIRLQSNIKSYNQNRSSLNIQEPLFARYFKIAPFVELVIREKDARSKKLRRIILKQYSIREAGFDYVQNFALDSLYRPQLLHANHFYTVLRYEYKNDRTFHPYSWNVESQIGQNFIKLNLETRLRIDYDVKNKSLYLRGYAGKFISTNTAADNNRYYLNTTFSGINDYLYDGIYSGRNENQGLWSKQVSMQEGGFKIPTNLYANPLGRSDNWLLALHLKTDLPFGKFPLRLYADIATFADAQKVNALGNVVSYNAGLELSLFKELLCIYAPLLSSKDYHNYLKEMYPKDRFVRSISFSINIQHFNGLRAHELLFKELSQ